MCIGCSKEVNLWPHAVPKDGSPRRSAAMCRIIIGGKKPCSTWSPKIFSINCSYRNKRQDGTFMGVFRGHSHAASSRQTFAEWARRRAYTSQVKHGMLRMHRPRVDSAVAYSELKLAKNRLARNGPLNGNGTFRQSCYKLDPLGPALHALAANKDSGISHNVLNGRPYCQGSRATVRHRSTAACSVAGSRCRTGNMKEIGSRRCKGGLNFVILRLLRNPLARGAIFQ